VVEIGRNSIDATIGNFKLLAAALFV